MFLDAADQKAALLALMKTSWIGQAVIFTSQTNNANEVCAFSVEAGITAEALHGNRKASGSARAGRLPHWRVSGYNRRALVQADISRLGFLPGDRH